MNLFLKTLKILFLLLLTFACLILIIVLIIFHSPYHEERYTLTAIKPELFSKPLGTDNRGVIRNRVNNVAITASLSPTTRENKGVWNWENATGPYEFRLQFNNHGLRVKRISIINIEIKNSSLNRTIYFKKSINESIEFPEHDEKDHPNYPKTMCIHIKSYKLESLQNLNFNSGEPIKALVKFIMHTEENSEVHEIEIIFEPELIEGNFQIPITT